MIVIFFRPGSVEVVGEVEIEQSGTSADLVEQAMEEAVISNLNELVQTGETDDGLIFDTTSAVETGVVGGTAPRNIDFVLLYISIISTYELAITLYNV